MRRALTEDDFWRAREFLRLVFSLNGRRELSWHVARLDYWRWHFVKTCQACDSFEQVTFLWETAEGEIVSALHPVFRGEAFLHVHPDFRTLSLEDEMLSVAEEHLAASNSGGQRELVILGFQDDDLRQRILSRRGYARRERYTHHWRRDLDAPIPDGPTVAAGYIVRSMGDASEFPARSWASWRAFHPDEPDDDYDGWDWYHNLQSAPLYRRDLDIVAATPNGEIVSFCTTWYDDVTRSAVCVLVGTVPEHQRRGLGKAVMLEGLRRVQQMGGTRVFANGYDPAANALYGSVLGTCDLSNPWEKLW